MLKILHSFDKTPNCFFVEKANALGCGQSLAYGIMPLEVVT